MNADQDVETAGGSTTEGVAGGLGGRKGRSGLFMTDATLEGRARLVKGRLGGVQVRAEGVDPLGRPIRVSYKVPHGSDPATVAKAMDRLVAGSPVTVRGGWVRSADGVRTMNARSIQERDMPGARPSPNLASLGPPIRDPRDVSHAAVLRQGVANVIGTAMTHPHDREPEHLAALQQHVGAFTGAFRGASQAARGSYGKAVARSTNDKGVAALADREDFKSATKGGGKAKARSGGMEL